MPWDYKTNKPDAVKYLHPKIQRKAIKIANAIVENGGDEGMAIATGIKKAKGLVKLAASNFKQFLRPIQRHKSRFSGQVIGGAGIGSIFGATVGIESSFKKDNYGYLKKDKQGRNIKDPKKSLLKRGLIGAAIGGTIGGAIAGTAAYKRIKGSDKYRKYSSERRRSWNNSFNERTNKPGRDYRSSYDGSGSYQEHQGGQWKYQKSDRENRWSEDFEREWKKTYGDYSYTPPPPRPSTTTDHAAFFKSHGIDHGSIKTKKEAEKHFRSIARKHHPDVNPGIDPDLMKKVNTEWEGVKNSSWFDKLAMIMERLKL